MQYSNYLAQMAALIKQNPSITVREIAAQLKFADSKSVYYWLEKGNIRGINEFKRLVLGEESALPSPFSVEIGGKAHYLVCLPLFSWNPRQKKAHGGMVLPAQPSPTTGLVRHQRGHQRIQSLVFGE